MVENTGPKSLVLEDVIAQMRALWDKDDHVKISEILGDIDESIEAGKFTKKDGSPASKEDPAWKEWAESEIGHIEIWGHNLRSDFWDAMEILDKGMEQFEDKALVEANMKLYYDFVGEGENTTMRLINILVFDCNMLVGTAICYEKDLIPKWLQNSKDESIKDIEMTIHGQPVPSVCSTSFTFPIPGMTSRFMSNYAICYVDRKTNGLLEIGAAHKEEDKKWFGYDLATKPEGSVFSNVEKSFRYLEKVDETHTKHVTYTEIKLQKDTTKEQMIENIIKKRTVAAAKNLKDTFGNIVGLYEQRVAEKKEFYDKFAQIYAAQEEDE